MGASISFCTLCKNCYKMQISNSIALIIGKNEEHFILTVDSCTKFAVYLRNIQGVMNVYPSKKGSNLSRLQGKPSIGIT